MGSQQGTATTHSSAAVLLIDDDVDLLTLLTRGLRRAVPETVAYDLYVAATPEDGLDRIQRIRADRPLIVFCDFNLRSGTTGADLLVDIARLRPRAVRVLISGSPESYLRPALDACRPDAFLEKPLDLEVLAEEMASLVVRTASRAEHTAPPHEARPRSTQPEGQREEGDEEQVHPFNNGGLVLEHTAAAAGAGQEAPEPLPALQAGDSVRDAYFRLMVESLTDYAAFLMDPTGGIVTWNRGAARIKGYQPEDIIGEHFSRFYPQPDIDAQKPTYELRRAAEEGRFENTGWRVRKDGTRFWANVIITALRGTDGKLLGYAKVTRDLTQQRTAEEMLRESEARYRLLLESVKDYAIIMLDVDGRIVSWSEGAFQGTGFTAADALGQHIRCFYPADAQRSGVPEADLERALRDGRYEEEDWRLRHDGSRFWANVVTTPLFDPLGRHQGFTLVMRDLTAKREAEESARQHNDEMRALLRELDAYNDAVAHDLRGPVRALLGYTSLLQEARADSEEQLHLQGKIRLVAERMADLIEDLLDLSRSTKRGLTRGPVDMSALVHEVVDAEVAERGVPREAFQVQEGMEAHADAGLMRIVFENLISNAVKFSAGRPLRVEVGRSDDAQAAFWVRDQGSGFDEARAADIFHPFVRLHNRRDYEGSGIGLATVHRIVARHGGRVWAESRPGDGATFFFTLG